MTEYDTVLFDSDGVLVEPPAYETQVEATRAAFGEVGIKEAETQYIDEVVSGLTIERLHEICVAYDLDPEVFWEAREHHDEQSQLTKFRDGSRRCYEDAAILSQLDQNRGIVSNNHHSTIEFVLNFFDLRSSFDIYYGREKTIESLRLKKPNTYYLEQALDDLDADSALYVGDSESDLVAAERTGISSVFVRRPHCYDEELTAVPTFETDDLYEVAALLE